MSKQLSIDYDETMLTKLFFQLMPVAILTMIIPSINSVIDITVASRFIGVDAVAAIGFYDPIKYILQGTSGILVGGAVILLGKLLGNGNENEASELFSTDVMVTFLIILFLSFVTYIGAEPISFFLGARDEVLALTADYIRSIAFSYPALYCAMHLSSFLELEQQHARNAIGIAMMLFLNLTMDIFFVCVLNMGTLGLGIATTVASWVNFAILVQYYFTGKAQLKFSCKMLKLKILPEVIKVGFPTAVTQIYFSLRGYMVNSMIMSTAGDVGIVALSAQSTLGALEYAFSYGISVAARTLFSVFVGSNDSESVKHIVRIAFKKIFPISFAFTIIFACLSVPFTRIFYDESAGVVYGLTVELFVYFALAMFLSGIDVFFENYYQCHGWLKITNILSFSDGLAGMVISMLILKPIFGIHGIWMSFVGNGIVTTIVVVVYTIISGKKIPTKLEDFLLLPDDFGIAQEHRMNFSVHNKEEVVMCSRKIDEFCKKENVDHRKTYFSSLALEEMADNIVTKGFTDGGRHTCVIEVANSSSKIILRIMDDGNDFNPLERIKIIDSHDITKNIGIHLVRKISDDMEYTRVVGLNILTICINH